MATSAEPSRPQRVDLGFVPQRPIRWLSPRELGSAGLRVALSSAFGEYSDKRELEELLDESLHPPRSDDTDGIWFDYVADLGDGFDPTYSIAELLSRQQVELDEGQALPRGSILLMGGDQVYPTADRDEYRNRLIGPFHSALARSDEPHPELYAVPGNHDWYDGLSSFIRLFCDRKELGGWVLPQTRSYFAAGLTPRWWLWGLDIQFDGYIDTPQLKFFRDVAGKHLNQGDGLVLCSAKPAWARAAVGDARPSESMRNLDFVLDSCVPDGVAVRLSLAGDWHHYSRYEDSTTAAQFVTSGGGGAYLSATHHLRESVVLRGIDPGVDRELQLRSVYPDRSYSKRRRWSALGVGAWNPSFAALMGLFYLLLGTVSVAARKADATFAEHLGALADDGIGAAFTSTMVGMVGGFGLALIVALAGGLVGLTTPRKLARPWVGIVLGLGHTAVHLVAVGAAVALSTWFISGLGDGTPRAVQWGVWVLAMSAGGLALGSMLFGAYLGLADLFAVNTNELFAAQRIEHRKHFLRMHVTDDAITGHVVALDRCPRWRLGTDATSFRRRTERTARARAASEPRLVEVFTVSREVLT